MTNVRGEGKQPGEIRNSRVYIRGKNGSLFTPPEPNGVRDALQNWESYLHQEERNPLVQLAILKAQFELIHPFYDGNGRIGRMLVPLILYDKKVLASPNFYISAYLDKNREEYLDRLEDISKKEDWNGWISFFLNAIKEQAEENSSKAIKIIQLHRDMERKISDVLRSQYTSRVINTLFSNPIFSSSHFVEISGIPKNTAKFLLRPLKENYIIEVLLEGQGSRASVYKFTSLLDITEQND
jgi:Fic family protein